MGVLAVLLLCSCASLRMQRVMIDGKAFDLDRGSYTAADPHWQRLSSHGAQIRRESRIRSAVDDALYPSVWSLS